MYIKLQIKLLYYIKGSLKKLCLRAPFTAEPSPTIKHILGYIIHKRLYDWALSLLGLVCWDYYYICGNARTLNDVCSFHSWYPTWIVPITDTPLNRFLHWHLIRRMSIPCHAPPRPDLLAVRLVAPSGSRVWYWKSSTEVSLNLNLKLRSLQLERMWDTKF